MRALFLPHVWAGCWATSGRSAGCVCGDNPEGAHTQALWPLWDNSLLHMSVCASLPEQRTDTGVRLCLWGARWRGRSPYTRGSVDVLCRTCHPAGSGDPRPGPQHRTAGSVAPPAPITKLSMLKRDCGPLARSDREPPGPLGESPAAAGERMRRDAYVRHHTCTHSCVCAYVYAGAHVCTHTRAHAHVYARLRAYAYVYIRTRACTHVRMTRKSAHTHACAYTSTRTKSPRNACMYEAMCNTRM